jgi:hypothetical protein
MQRLRRKDPTPQFRLLGFLAWFADALAEEWQAASLALCTAKGFHLTLENCHAKYG